MRNYAEAIPTDENGQSMTNWPAPVLSTTRYQKDNAVTSSVWSLNPQTSQIEVSTVGGQGAVIRWVPLTETAGVAPAGSVIASGLTANFDHHIPANTYRQFVVPKETQGAPSGQVGSLAGLYQRVAVINAGAGPSSVLVTEY